MYVCVGICVPWHMNFCGYLCIVVAALTFRPQTAEIRVRSPPEYNVVSIIVAVVRVA